MTCQLLLVLPKAAPLHWSVQELIVHLADSDAIAIDRMKRVVAEDNPQFLNADEAAYVRELHCHSQSIEDAIDLFEIGRRQFARVLRQLPEAAFDRIGTHSVVGEVTLRNLVETYVEHLDHHLSFLRQKRERLGV